MDSTEQAKGPTEWNEGRHGVGPWEGPWPDDPRLDPQFLEEGDRRNVVDAYRYWSLEAIREELDTRRHPFHVAIENFENDANIGTVVRTANAFLAEEVHIIGRRRWNRRGAMVTDRYQHIRHARLRAARNGGTSAALRVSVRAGRPRHYGRDAARGVDDVLDCAVRLDALD